ncbi:MAG: histidine phosphatase family protein [Bacteroidota bacterium]
MSKSTIYIIRHGQTEFNRQHIIQGSGVDSSLNDTGRQQAKAFFDHYKEVPFELVLTSSLKRTRETASWFIDRGITWEKWPEINEIGWGIHEGKESEPWMKDSYLRVVGEWKRGNFSASVEGGESAAEMIARLSKFVDHLRQRTEENILVCSHGRAMRCLMCLLNDQSASAMENYRHANTGLYQFRLEDGRFHMLKKNDTVHLSNT